MYQNKINLELYQILIAFSIYPLFFTERHGVEQYQMRTWAWDVTTKYLISISKKTGFERLEDLPKPVRKFWTEFRRDVKNTQEQGKKERVISFIVESRRWNDQEDRR